jgi:hypothetical protein
MLPGHAQLALKSTKEILGKTQPGGKGQKIPALPKILPSGSPSIIV